LLAVNPGVFGLARYAILDTVFTAFLFGGAALLTIAALRDRPSLQWPGYVAIACAVLTKGPLALVLCGLTLIAASMASADLRRRLFGLRWIAGLALILAIAAPWFIYMYVRFRQDFVDGYVLDENLRLFAASRFENQPGPLFYVQILAAGFLPWTGVLIGRLLDDAGAVIRGERLDPVETLLWLWLLVVVAFFSASTFKLDHYVFPAAPAMCLLCARALEDVRTGSARRSTWSRVGAFTVGPTLVAIGIAMAVLLLTRLALPRAALVIPAALISCGLAFTIGVWRRSSARLSALVPWSALVALGVTYAGLIAFALPALEEHKVAPDLARFVASHATTEDRVATYRLNRLTPAFRFYVNRHTDFLETPPQAEAMFASGRQFYCVMAREAYDELTARGARLAILYQRQGMWVTSGRLLFRSHPAPTTFVVVGQAR
jgi:4-amino-4-deoxy-L-arabinose transferase-like glycosyltransferase